MLGNSTKHAQHNETYSRRDAQAVLEMARVVAGGDRELRERPIVSTYQCCISPLVYDEGPIEAAIEFARGGLPSGFISMGIPCATAPATLAGTLVSMNAEMVGGMTIVEALVPGAVTFCGPYPTFMDLRTGGLPPGLGSRGHAAQARVRAARPPVPRADQHPVARHRGRRRRTGRRASSTRCR